LLPYTIGCSADADTARTQTHDGWRRAELTGEDATASAQAETVEGTPFGEFQDLLIVESVLLVPGFFFLAATLERVGAMVEFLLSHRSILFVSVGWPSGQIKSGPPGASKCAWNGPLFRLQFGLRYRFAIPLQPGLSFAR
jgi:hypothetical protein